MTLLAEILARKREELRALGPAPDSDFRPRPLGLARGPGEPLRLIAEIKRRSPSAGPLSSALSVAERARAYEHAGASMISVLTDTKYFDGSFAHLAAARAASRLPLLCKDFVLTEAQLDWALASGADAVLLIVRCLEQRRLTRLMAACRERGLSALVEIAESDEASRALDAGAELVGVNARDLDSLTIDRARAARVLESLPPGVLRVHLSGVADAPDVARLARAQLDAALIGEALMRQADPGRLLSDMRAAAG